MPAYIDPQDAAAARSAEAREQQSAQLNKVRADQSAFTERARGGMYRDARAAKGDQLVRAQCTAAGIVNEPQILEAQARLRERDAALLKENPELSPEAYLDILKAPSRPLTPEALKAREEFVVATNRIPVYRTKSDVLDLIAGANAALPAERPVLNQHLRDHGGSVSPPVLRPLIEQAAGRKDAALRSLTAGKPFGAVPAPAAKPADPGQWPFK